LNGVMKIWFEMEQEKPGSAINHAFVQEHANGCEQLREHVMKLPWEEIEKSAGLSRERLKEFAVLLAGSRSGVFVWSMGWTQHRFAADNISQVANLAVLRGCIGRKHCGVMPIRGHSGVQGSGEMGADPFSLPGGDFEEKSWTRIEEARAEWEIYVDLAARVSPEKKQLMHFSSAEDIRAEIAQANPNYDGIQHLQKRGDFFQWGGAWLCEDGHFPTADGKANLLPIEIPNLNKPEGSFLRHDPPGPAVQLDDLQRPGSV